MNTSLLITLSVILGYACFGAVRAANYCKASLCPGKRHIACGNNGAFKAQCARDAKVIPVTGALRTGILHKHNTLRNNIARGGLSRFQRAGRMATMQWDNELARLAVLNVKQCALKHDACRATDRFPYAGQNLALTAWFYLQSKTPLSVAHDQIQGWFNEHKDATMAQINKYRNNGRVVGHFTQMVLEKANRVGCGIVRQTMNSMTYQFLACNYAYVTFIGKPVYTRANRAAAQCKTGRNPNYAGLCSTKEFYAVKQQ